MTQLSGTFSCEIMLSQCFLLMDMTTLITFVVSLNFIAIAGPGPGPVPVQSKSVRESLRMTENDKDLDQGIAL